MSKLKKSHLISPSLADNDERDQADSVASGSFDANLGQAPAEFSLADHFLIAMPSMLDPVFGGTVIYVCEHSSKGAMGLVINKPTDMTVASLFDKIDLKLEIIPDSHPNGRDNVLFGGPVQEDRGFVLHAPVGRYNSSLKVTEQIAFTTSRDVLESVAAGDGPERMLISLECGPVGTRNFIEWLADSES